LLRKDYLPGDPLDRLDKLLSERLNVQGKFIANAVNAKHKGKTVAEVVAMWDEAQTDLSWQQ
jgi:hypothetical protein